MRYLGIYLLLFALVCAIATFVENAYSTDVAKAAVYNTHWFEAILIIAQLSLIYNIIIFKLYTRGKAAIGLYHFAFVIMIAGAGITRYTGEEGKIHLREGESTHFYLQQSPQGDISEARLPFEIKLNDFEVSYYPGSQTPSDYKSLVLVSPQNQAPFIYEIYMNQVLKYKGFRLYQSSYDEDMKGSILSVNHDPWGMGITYLGYALMALGMVLSLFAKQSRFQSLIKELKKWPTTVIILGMIGSFSTLHAAPTVEQATAKNFGKIWVHDGKGRIQPLNTYNLKLLKKFSHESSYEGHQADQIILSILIAPDEWQNEAIIYIEDELAKEIGINGNYASYNQFFDQDEQYKLMQALNAATSKSMDQRDKKDKAILNVTERISVFRMVLDGSFLAIYPHAEQWQNPNNVAIEMTLNRDLMIALKQQNEKKLQQLFLEIQDWQYQNEASWVPSKTKMKAELIYNQLNIFDRLAPLYATLAILLLLMAIIKIIKNKSKLKLISYLEYLLFAAFFIQTSGIILRWYISGRAPMSNGYESMLIVSWASILGGIFFSRKSPITLAISTLLAAATLLVAHINSMNPEITVLVPVLNSYWLSSHVASITASYGLLSMSALLGFFNLVVYAFSQQKRWILVTQELSTISRILMIFGLYLLTIGCFIGAIWANESWGRYWSWDPKETWCLITIVVYTFILHMHHVPALSTDKVYNIGSVWALGAIIMTYFGVNYFLGGMHSYAGGEAPDFPSWAYLSIIVLLLLSARALFSTKN